MEPDVIRMYSSSPPPLTDDCSGDLDDDGVDDFGDFDTYCSVPASVSFSELSTPTTFNQTEALGATSPPELLLASFGRAPPSNGAHTNDSHELLRANGVVPAGHLGSASSERTEVKKVISSGPDIPAGGGELADCNGDDTPALTNGFSSFDPQESPSPQNCVHSDLKGAPPSGEDRANAPQDDFADFAAFAPDTDNDADGACSQTLGGAPEVREGEEEKAELPAQGTVSEEQLRDRVRTSSSSDKEPEASGEFCTNGAAAVNGLDGSEDSGEAGPWDGKENDTETETETSLGRPLSTEALEELGDISATTGSAPLGGEAATPAEHSQLVEDDDEDDGVEDFGDFGDPASFTDFQQPDIQEEPSGASPPLSSGPAHQAQDEDDFGDFNSPEFDQVGGGGAEAEFADFPPSDSFGNFSSAADDGGGWSAFGGGETGLEEGEAEEGESWAAFSSEQSLAPPAASTQQQQEEEEDWHEGVGGAPSSRTEMPAASLSSRLENLFQVSFPQTGAPQRLEDTVVSLKSLLGGAEQQQQQQQQQEGDQEQQEIRPSTGRSTSSSVWLQLQDIHEALGLRYQWGGSHCNKVLLCSLGIDTRNILFTGQKKQPVIVPMYAASLGMLEPTKEPVKPVSAAEMIASIAQTPPAASEQSSCPSDTVQEALPPIQFDWSSSGLTNPLDASGGSSLLNLDFFGPVEDSGSSSSASIPGVDPELYELTTAKLDAGAPSSRVADAFARLMSTMDKTSTATRKPRKEEHLSEEAAKVMASLPDLSFMQAKVLMFPATLTPLSSQATPD